MKPDHAKLSAYFNVDNGTRPDPRHLRRAQRGGGARSSRPGWRPLKDLGATTVTLRPTRGTDHVSFDAVGLPAFQFIQDDADYETRTHHTNLDVFDRLQKDGPHAGGGGAGDLRLRRGDEAGAAAAPSGAPRRAPFAFARAVDARVHVHVHARSQPAALTMEYREWPPHPALRPFVRAYWALHGRGAAVARRSPCCPTGRAS